MMDSSLARRFVLHPKTKIVIDGSLAGWLAGLWAGRGLGELDSFDGTGLAAQLVEFNLQHT